MCGGTYFYNNAPSAHFSCPISIKLPSIFVASFFGENSAFRWKTFRLSSQNFDACVQVNEIGSIWQKKSLASPLGISTWCQNDN